MATQRLRLAVGIASASVVLGAASTAAFAVAGPGNLGGPFRTAPQSCDVPALPGTVVDVTLTDMPGAMMSPGMGPSMMGRGWERFYGPGMMSGRGPIAQYGAGTLAPGYAWPGMHMMSLLINPATVPAGQVSFRVINTGVWIHELTVLPLGSGQNIGQRRIEADNQVDESASIGHVEGSCGAVEGEGIIPGSTGWTTITLTPGRYELICNVAGHYRAGAYALLEVTG